MISKFNSITFPLQVPFRGEILSSDINAFAKSVSTDNAAVSSIINQIVTMLNTVNSQDKLDGSNIVVDLQASEDKDNGIFYFTHPTDSGQSHPLTIYEALVVMLQIMANIENGMKEGVKIGEESAPVDLANNEVISYAWPYGSNIFDYKLFYISGDEILKIDPADYKINIDTSTLEPTIKIQNISGGATSIFGYVWHPVFTF